jgi:hypothetical protein
MTWRSAKLGSCPCNCLFQVHATKSQPALAGRIRTQLCLLCPREWQPQVLCLSTINPVTALTGPMLPQKVGKPWGLRSWESRSPVPSLSAFQLTSVYKWLTSHNHVCRHSGSVCRMHWKGQMLGWELTVEQLYLAFHDINNHMKNRCLERSRENKENQ